MYLAPIGNTVRICCVKFDFADFFLFTPQRLVTQDDLVRQYAMRVVKEKKTKVAKFGLFVRTSPIDFALLGGTRNRLKSKMTSKLKEKQTSIAMVRDPLPTFAIFSAPLLSQYRLPLIETQGVYTKQSST